MYFIYVFILKSPPPFPTHRVPFATRSYTCDTWSVCLDLHPSQLCTKYNNNKNSSQFTVHMEIRTKIYQCSTTCPSLCLHRYGRPTGCPWVELCTSWHGWQGGWHLPSCPQSSSPMPHEGHPWLPGPNVGKMQFLLLPLTIVWGRFLSPPSFSSIHAY